MGNQQEGYHIHHGSLRKKMERERREIFHEIMIEIFSNLIEDVNINIQAAQQTPRKMNSKNLKHSIIKFSKAEEKKGILKTAKEKRLITSEILRKIISRFLRNFKDQNAMGQYIESAERKNNCQLPDLRKKKKS